LRASDQERQASQQIHSWNAAFYKQFPEATNAAALAETQQRNPARFAQIQQAATKVAQNIDGWMKAGAAATEARERQEAEIVQRQQAATRVAWENYKAQHDELAQQRIPELQDAQKKFAMQAETKAMLKDRGFDDREVAAAWNGHTGVSLRDYRVQSVIADATRWRMAQARAKDIASKRAPVPPVMRPGTYRPAGADSEADIGRLERALSGARGERAALRAATKLTQARRAAGRL
jgi:hypothetical protein